MQEKERQRVLDRKFTSWFLTFGELVKQSKVFQVRDVNEANRVMSVSINGKEILLTLNPDSNTLMWMSGQGSINLSELSGNGWVHSKGRAIFDKKNYETLYSPKIDTGKHDVQILFVRDLDTGDQRVTQSGAQKLSQGI